jgi:hypothetical protein
MPYSLPRSREQQEAYNHQLQEAYVSTRRVSPSAPGVGQKADRDPIETLKELAGLHESGLLTDEEFAQAKAKLLGSPDDKT